VAILTTAACRLVLLSDAKNGSPYVPTRPAALTIRYPGNELVGVSVPGSASGDGVCGFKSEGNVGPLWAAGVRGLTFVVDRGLATSVVGVDRGFGTVGFVVDRGRAATVVVVQRELAAVGVVDDFGPAAGGFVVDFGLAAGGFVVDRGLAAAAWIGAAPSAAAIPSPTSELPARRRAGAGSIRIAKRMFLPVVKAHFVGVPGCQVSPLRWRFGGIRSTVVCNRRAKVDRQRVTRNPP
jgi:hypothetical protein